MWWGRPRKRSAEEIVHAFAEFLGRTDLLIGDDRVLPMQRGDLLRALQEYRAFLEHRVSLFHEPKIEKKLAQVMAVMPYAFDFQRIDSEDIADVHAINNGSEYEFCRQSADVLEHVIKTDPVRKSRYMQYLKLFLKYHGRAVAESDALIGKS